MSRAWRRRAAAVLGCAVLAGGSAPTRVVGQDTYRLADVSVLSGCWAGGSDSVQLREHWTEAEGGTMLGSTRFLRGDAVVDWEFGRIVEDADGVTLWPYPRGVMSTDGFPLVRADSLLVFENVAHDFPVRIVYARDGGDGRAANGVPRLRVRIEGRDGDGREWAMQRVPCPGPSTGDGR